MRDQKLCFPGRRQCIASRFALARKRGEASTKRNRLM
jgi:hypothetical protein